MTRNTFQYKPNGVILLSVDILGPSIVTSSLQVIKKLAFTTFD